MTSESKGHFESETPIPTDIYGTYKNTVIRF